MDFSLLPIVISQDGDNISGTFECVSASLTCLHPSGTLSGIVSGNVLTSAISFPDGHSCGALDAEVDGNEMSGEYGCSDPVANDFGTWSVPRQQ